MASRHYRTLDLLQQGHFVSQTHNIPHRLDLGILFNVLDCLDLGDFLRSLVMETLIQFVGALSRLTQTVRSRYPLSQKSRSLDYTSFLWYTLDYAHSVQLITPTIAAALLARFETSGQRFHTLVLFWKTTNQTEPAVGSWRFSSTAQRVGRTHSPLGRRSYASRLNFCVWMCLTRFG